MTVTVHVMTGLPASGKTTLATRLVAEAAGRMRYLSRDDLRQMLNGGIVPASVGEYELTERAVKRMLVLGLRELVADGWDVVVDATHLHEELPLLYCRQVAGFDVAFRVHDLTGVPVAECLRRDPGRARPCGEKGIRFLQGVLARTRAQGWRLTDEWMAAQVAARR